MMNPTHQHTTDTQLTWIKQGVGDILPEEFYNLIEKNRKHLRKTFPQTVAICVDEEATAGFLIVLVEREERKDNVFLFMRDVATREVIGLACAKNINFNLAKCELAYFIDKDYEGRGIVTAAVGELLAPCFDELKMNKICIYTPITNIGSQKVALRNGFTQEGILKEEFNNGDAGFEDVVYFGLRKEDYNNER